MDISPVVKEPPPCFVVTIHGGICWYLEPAALSTQGRYGALVLLSSLHKIKARTSICSEARWAEKEGWKSQKNLKGGSPSICPSPSFSYSRPRMVCGGGPAPGPSQQQLRPPPAPPAPGSYPQNLPPSAHGITPLPQKLPRVTTSLAEGREVEKEGEKAIWKNV